MSIIISGGGGSSVGPDLLASAAEGRMDLTTAGIGSSISWPAGKRISLVNSDGVLELMTPTSAISFLNTALDINSTAIAGGTIPYAVYLEHNGTTTGADVVLVKWTNATTRAVALADWLGFDVYDLTTAGKQRRHIGDILPRIHWNPAAAWSNTTSYVIGEPCTSGGHTFLSIKTPNLNHATSDTTYWQDCGVSPGDGRGSFADQMQFRLILNAYNTEPRSFGVVNPYTGTTSESLAASSTLQVPMKDGNSNTVWKAEALCSGIDPVDLTFVGCVTESTVVVHSIGMDSMTVKATNAANLQGAYDSLSTKFVDTPSAGYHYFVPLVLSRVTSKTLKYFYFDGSVNTVIAQFLGTWRG